MLFIDDGQKLPIVMDTETLAEDAQETESVDAAVDSQETSETQLTDQNEAPVEDQQALADEVVVSIDGESPTPEDDVNAAPKWVKDLRKEHRAVLREKKELEARLKAIEEGAKAPEALGEKPTLANCEFDADRFEVELLKWNERKQKLEAEKAKKVQAEEEEKKSAQQRFEEYTKKKAELKVPDFADAEDAVVQKLSLQQQSIILQGAERPELVVYAIGKSPAKAAELAAITDPVKFAMAVARLEGKLKIEPKTAPSPEKKVVGAAKMSGSDPMLEKLRTEAERTGDYSKVHQYKMQLRKKE